ncbi:hypothetical protein PG984_008397 [Apiospora sp. TS-2023a]
MDLDGLLNSDDNFDLNFDIEASETWLCGPSTVDSNHNLNLWVNDTARESDVPLTHSTGGLNQDGYHSLPSMDDECHHTVHNAQESTFPNSMQLDHHIVQVAQQDMSTLFEKIIPDSLGNSFFTIEQSSDRIALLLGDGTDFGYLRKHLIQTFEELRQKAPNLTFEAVAVTKDVHGSLSRATKPTDARCHVDINIYGPQDQAELAGSVLLNHKLWLQRPDRYQKVNSTYMNPHTITFPELDGDMMLQEPRGPNGADQKTSQTDEEALEQVISGVYGHSKRDKELGMESGGPSITTELLPHQGRALKFMLERESGDIPAEFRLWSETLSGSLKVFVHQITGARAYAVPEERGGGVLADEMGTGKTLSTLALITRTLDAANDWLKQKQDNQSSTTKIDRHSTATLIIVPSAQLIANWVNEIDCHTGMSLRTFKYHGIERERDVEALAASDVIITTYNTLAWDYEKKSSALHAIGWYRVVLDEAHYIRNHTTKFYRACCDLEAHSRWCITGTPIQNRLQDIGSLFSFLRVEPFSSRAEFRRLICLPFENRDMDTLRDRLVLIYDSLVLRRSKDTCVLDLPDPEEELKELDFSPDEAAQYANTLQVLERRLRNQAYFQQGLSTLHILNNEILEDSSYADDNSSLETSLHRHRDEHGGSPFNMFHAMMQLRILCNHGTYQHMFSWEKQGGSAQEEREALLGPPGAGSERSSLEARKFNTDISGDTIMSEVNGDYGRSLDSTPPRLPHYFREHGISTKINWLMKDLTSESEMTKSIVFSCWTRTLDLIEACLKTNGMDPLRIDGKRAFRDRQRTIKRFEEDPSARILLMTTGTGAHGLNLTAANHIFIFELQWNPSIEKQAIARAIRIGQTRQVRVTRYLIRNTVEQEMFSQQDTKRRVAAVGFSHEDVHVT